MVHHEALAAQEGQQTTMAEPAALPASAISPLAQRGERQHRPAIRDRARTGWAIHSLMSGELAAGLAWQSARGTVTP